MEVDLLGRGPAGGGGLEEQGCTEVGKFYDVEVELLDEEEAPSDIAVPVTDDVTACDVACQRPGFISLNPGPFDLFGGGVSSTAGRGLFMLLKELRRTVLPAHWVAVLADGPVLQLLQCSKLSSMTDTIVHIGPDLHVHVSVRNRLLPDAHTLYREHTHRVDHLSQLVSLLLGLERMFVCHGSRVRSPACHLLLAPPCLTCLPCLLEEEDEDEDDEDEDEEDDEGEDEV